MNHVLKILAAIAFIFVTVMSGCSSDDRTAENQNSDSLAMSRGELERDGGESRGEEGEESGRELALNEGCDMVRNGVRLVMDYDAQSNSFNGTVENTTDNILKRVRVEVHLSNGMELGPTTPADLQPGEKNAVKLTATNKGFIGWTAHAEIGSSEHGRDEEHGEHDGAGRSEHK